MAASSSKWQFLWKIRGSNSKMLQWNGSLQLQYTSNSKENKKKKHMKKTEKHNSQNNSGPFIIFSYIRVYLTMFIEIAMHWEILDWTYNYLCSVGHFPCNLNHSVVNKAWKLLCFVWSVWSPPWQISWHIFLKNLFDISDIYIYCTIWHLWHAIWHCTWHSIWHSIWHVIWHDIWHSIWCKVQVCRGPESWKRWKPAMVFGWPSRQLLKSRDPLLAGEKVVGG